MIRRLSFSALLLPVLLLAACGRASGAPTTSHLSTASPATSATANTTASATSNDASTGAASTSSSSSGSASSSGGVAFTVVQNQSRALYKARETLVNIGSPTEAVGQTSRVSGTIVFTDSGAIDSAASRITIDLSTLQSDRSERDNYIKRNTLDTATYPDAVFVSTDVHSLSWPLPASSRATFKLTGNLTVHGQTSQTTWDVTATFGPLQVQGSATTMVKFEDFGMKPPRTMLVMSVEDNLTLELDFVFTRRS